MVQYLHVRQVSTVSVGSCGLTQKHKTKLKIKCELQTLQLFAAEFVTKKKGIATLKPGTKFIKLFTAIIYEF